MKIGDRMDTKSHLKPAMLISWFPWILVLGSATIGYFVGFSFFSGKYIGLEAFLVTIHGVFIFPFSFVIFIGCIAIQASFLGNYYRTFNMLLLIIIIFLLTLPINIIMSLRLGVFEETTYVNAMITLANFIMVIWPSFFFLSLLFKSEDIPYNLN